MYWSREKENDPRCTVQYLFGILSMNSFQVYEHYCQSFMKNLSSTKYTHPLPSPKWPPSLACSEKASQYSPFQSGPTPPVMQPTCPRGSLEEGFKCTPFNPDTVLPYMFDNIHVRAAGRPIQHIELFVFEPVLCQL